MSMQRPSVVVMTTIPQTLAAFFPRQLRHLAGAGFEVHAISSPSVELDAFGAECGIATHGIPMERKPHPVKDVISLARLTRLLRRIRPDVVHAHTPKAGLVGMAAAKAAGVPVRLYTVHGLPLLTRHGVWRRVLEMAEMASAALATRTYAVSDSLRDVMIETGLCRPGHVHVLGHGSCAGIDVDRFANHARRDEVRRAYGIPSDAVVAAFVGRLTRDKGVGVLAEAWRELAVRLPNLHLLLAGEADATDPVPADQMAALSSHPRVHCTGTVTHAAMPGIYAAADFGVLPTFREGLGQVALECGAARRAMVSTRIPGIRNAVVDGGTGILVQPGSASGLATAMEQLALDGALRVRMGAAGHEFVRMRFSEAYVNGLWIEEYLRLAGSPAPRRIQAEARAGHTY